MRGCTPIERAASTKSCCFRVSTFARTSRLTPIQESTPMTTVITAMLWPATRVSTIRMKRVGMLNKASVNRIKLLSIHPW